MHLQTTSFGVLGERVRKSWMRQFNVLLFNDKDWGRGNKIIFEGVFSSNKSPEWKGKNVGTNMYPEK